jgi:hypothetical protein
VGGQEEEPKKSENIKKRGHRPKCRRGSPEQASPHNGKIEIRGGGHPAAGRRAKKWPRLIVTVFSCLLNTEHMSGACGLIDRKARRAGFQVQKTREAQANDENGNHQLTMTRIQV